MNEMALEIPREIGRPFLDGIEAHASQVGQIVWGWNFLQSQFLHVFRELVCPENKDLALALWHSLPSDKGQRDMTVNAASAKLGKESELLKDIVWVRARAQDIGNIRNASVHTGISIGASNDWPPEMHAFPDVNSGKPGAVSLLTSKPIREQWSIIRDDLWVLGRFTCSLAGRVNGSAPGMYGPSNFARPVLVCLQ